MIGVMSVIPTKGAIFAQIAFMGVWALVYQATIGSVAWPLVTEVSRSSLRGHTQSLTTITNGIAGAISGAALPYLVNPDQAKAGLSPRLIGYLRRGFHQGGLKRRIWQMWI
jgi:hypothetical protein